MKSLIFPDVIIGSPLLITESEARFKGNCQKHPKGAGHSGPLPGVTLQILEIKKIYQCIANNVNLSVLKLEKRYLHQNGIEFNQNFVGN